jgi:outer membrane protein assembly factor BamB
VPTTTTIGQSTSTIDRTLLSPPPVVAAGQFSDLTLTPAGMYAVVTSSGGTFSQVVRLDETDGHVLSRSPVLADVGNLSTTSTALWVTATAGRSVEPQALFRLDPATLAATLVGGVGNPTGSASDGADRLWVTAGCTLTRLDPSDGTVVARVTLPPLAHGANGCVETAAVSDSMLFVSVYTSEETFSLEARTGDTGALLDSSDLGDVGPTGVSLAPAGRYLWAVFGVNGGAGYLLWYNTDPLTKLGATPGDPPVPEGLALPTVGHAPTVNLSGGVLWAGGTGHFACLDPSTGATRATFEETTSNHSIDGPIVRTSTGTWAVTQPDSGPSTVVRISPPPPCSPISDP